MEWNDLPKQKQLLIYMFYYEAKSGLAITMSKNGNDIIAYGISKNKNALANMLYTLCKKHVVFQTKLQDGNVAYALTTAGEEDALHWIRMCNSNANAGDSLQIPENANDHIAKLNAEIASLKQKLEQAEAEAEHLRVELKTMTDANMYLDKKKTELCVENDELAARLANVQQTLHERCFQLNEKAKKVEHLEDSLEKIAASCSQMGRWAITMKDGGI